MGNEPRANHVIILHAACILCPVSPNQVAQHAWELDKREAAVKEAENALRRATERLSGKELELAGREKSMLDREKELQSTRVGGARKRD